MHPMRPLGAAEVWIAGRGPSPTTTIPQTQTHDEPPHHPLPQHTGHLGMPRAPCLCPQATPTRPTSTDPHDSMHELPPTPLSHPGRHLPHLCVHPCHGDCPPCVLMPFTCHPPAWTHHAHGSLTKVVGLPEEPAKGVSQDGSKGMAAQTPCFLKVKHMAIRSFSTWQSSCQLNGVPLPPLSVKLQHSV